MQKIQKHPSARSSSHKHGARLAIHSACIFVCIVAPPTACPNVNETAQPNPGQTIIDDDNASRVCCASLVAMQTHTYCRYT